MEDPLLPFDQLYELKVDVVDKTDALFWQYVIAPLITGNGFGLTVIVTLSVLVQLAADTPVNVYVVVPSGGVKAVPSVTPLFH
jgi:hypothetical protein